MEEENNLAQTPISQEDADKAFALEGEIKVVKTQVQGNYLELGRLLKEIRDNRYYTLLGFETISEWLSSPDISITRTWASSAIRLYEEFVLKLGKSPDEIKNIDYTKLVAITGIIQKHPSEAEEWFEKARNLRRIDLQSEIKTKKISDRVEKIEELRTIQPMNGIIHGDPIIEVKKLETGSVDVVITAPPSDTPAFVFQDLFSELRRVVKPEGSIFVFSDSHNLFSLANAFQLNDYHLIRDIVLMYSSAKKNVGLNQLLAYHESVLWVSRGDKYSYNLTEIERDVWHMQPIEEPVVETEKPPSILLKLVEASTDQTKTVLDPFAGSGNIILAVKTLGRSYIGIEQDELYYKLMLEKLQFS